MKKIIGALLAMVAVMPSPAMADDSQKAKLYVSSSPMMKPGSTVEVDVALRNNIDISAFLFHLSLPEGLSVVKSGTSEDCDYDMKLSQARCRSTHSLSLMDTRSHNIQAAVASLTDFRGNDGTIVTMTIKAADNLKTGTLKAKLRNISFSDVDAASYEQDDYEFYINVVNDDEAPRESCVITDGESYTSSSITNWESLSYVRTFPNTDWQALYVPFSLSYDDWKDDFDIAYINNMHEFDTDNDDVMDRLSMEVIKVKGGTLYPNHPYMIRPKSAGTKTISVSNAMLYPAEKNTVSCSSTSTRYDFIGTYSELTGLKSMGCYVMSSEGLCQVGNNTASLKPLRWYMMMNNLGGQTIAEARAKLMSIDIVVLDDEDEATATVMTKEDIMNGDAFYDLYGHNRGTDFKALEKGVYIRNNKKYIVR